MVRRSAKAGSAHLGEQLLAYIDGELSPAEAEAVEAHLVACPECAAELAALQSLERDLAQTVDAVMSPLRLSREADHRIRAVLQERVERRERAGWFWRLWGRRMQLAQAVLAMVVLAFSVSTLQALRLPAPPPTQEVLVLGETRLEPGRSGALRVVVRTAGNTSAATSGSSPARAAPVRQALDRRYQIGAVAAMAGAGAPVAGAHVAIALRTASGAIVPLYEGVTDRFGTADAAFAVPEIEEGAATLKVETTSDAGQTSLERAVTIARTYKLYVMLDKPAYRPGQLVRARVLALDGSTLQPVAGETVTWHVAGADGDVVCTGDVALSAEGVGPWTCALPASLSPDAYVVRAHLSDTVSERALQVAEYTLPAFSVDLETNRSYYAPGDIAQVTVSAATFFGLPLRESEVAVRAHERSIEGRLISQARGRTGDEGRTVLGLPLPTDLGDGQLVLEAEVVDGAGQRAGLRRSLVISRTPLVVRAVPESGVLKPGVENALYLIVTYPDGRPAEAELEVAVGGERYSLSTDAYGLAALRIIPSGDTALTIAARASDGAEVVAEVLLAADQAVRSLLLRTASAVHEVGDTLIATALLSGDLAEVVHLDVVRDRHLVAALTAPVEDGAASFALDLDPSLAGTLELRAYVLVGAEVGPRDARVVVVDPSSALRVDIAADRERYAPGDLARLTFTTRETAGASVRPVSAVLGLSVVDTSVLALDTLPASLARAYLLAGEEILAREGASPGLDLASALDGLGDATQAQDSAARAAWADVPVPDASLDERQQVVPEDTALIARRQIARWLYGTLSIVPLIVAAAVAAYVYRARLMPVVLKRTVVALLIGVVVSPLLFAGLILGWLLPRLGVMAFLGALAVAVILLAVLVATGIRRRRTQLRRFVARILGYLILAGLGLVLASSGAGPIGLMIVVLVSGFMLLLLAVLVEGQVLLAEGARAEGWCTTGLALALVVLAITAPAVPALQSELTEAVGSPSLYVGPLGWLSGCAVATPAPEGEPAEPESTAVAEVEATEEPLPQPTASPMPTATPQVGPGIPIEPYPLRQVFPETLYWDPEAQTDAAGRLPLELRLADSVTTWQVTALASTRSGAIGSGGLSLVVSQDVVLGIDAPDEVTEGNVVTLTLTVYNTTSTARTVVWQLPDVDGFETVREPDTVRVAGRSGASAIWTIRPMRAGLLGLEVGAMGETSGDRVLVEIEVVP